MYTTSNGENSNIITLFFDGKFTLKIKLLHECVFVCDFWGRFFERKLKVKNIIYKILNK